MAVTPSATDLVVDALATARLVRLVQQDEVWPMPELRNAYLRRVGDSRLSDLASCPWCLSIWMGGAVALVAAVAPKRWRPLARVLAGSQVTGQLAELAS